MAPARIRQGELAHWLGVIAAQPAGPGADAAESPDDAPSHILEALELLACIRRQHGGWVVTEKGRLALRMADPAAFHR